MVFLKAWLLLPVVLGLVSLGLGLLVEAAAGFRLPRVLLVPIGLATTFVVARAAMVSGATAELATPLIAVGAVAGFVLGRGRLDRRGIDGWPIAATLLVFAVYAAPIVLSGTATFAGYTILGDTAVHFALVDRISTAGSNVAGLPPSSYRTILESYFASGYPLGTHAALGAVRPLAFVDVAWAFQPFLAFIGAALTLTLAGLLGPVLGRGWRRAAVAALAAQPALVFAYAMQGSVKELATLWLVPLLAALVPLLPVAADRASLAGELRRLIPLAVASAAAVTAIGVAVAPWLGPVLLVGLWRVGRGRWRDLRRLGVLVAGFAAGATLLALSTLADLGDYLDVTKTTVTTQSELGNLLAPLHFTQVFGIWLSGDYRLFPKSGPDIDALSLTYLLIGLAAVAAILGIAWLVRRRALGPLLFLVSSALALWYVTRTGSPWADAKALAIASPAVVLVAGVGPVALESRGARPEAAVMAVLLAVGVVTSNALIYHGVSLAPHDRLQELADLGDRTAGQGPLLYTDFEEFDKHFLRDSQPVGASEAYDVPGLTPELAGGGRAPYSRSIDVGLLSAPQVNRFRLLVQPRSPAGDRPPDGWRRIWTGRYYELWRRERNVPVVAQASPPEIKCADLRRLAGTARRRGARLAAAVAPPFTELAVPRRGRPAGWTPRVDYPFLLQTVGAGRVSGTLAPPAAGLQEVWLYGSFGREVGVRIDGRRVGGVSDELSQPAAWVQIGTVRLGPGRHRIEIVRGGGNLAPGNGDGPRTLGPLALRSAGATTQVVDVPPSRWRSLCYRPLKWVDAIRPTP
jgi:hypothetical protein